tara:strand:+ start:1830 stop:2414 length:585 start_codon:yes stop_codon:yes gene_type:complete
MSNYQSLIINFLENDLESINDKLLELENEIENLDDSSTIWIISSKYTDGGEIILPYFEIAEKLNNLKLKNIILVPDFSRRTKNRVFTDNTYEILFLSKTDSYFFDKDPIREEHIWKNVEWGKRKKNYHELGKDPGNVWLKTKDDGKANITDHVELSFKEVIERIILCSTKKDSKCLLVNIKKNSFNVESEIVYA